MTTPAELPAGRNRLAGKVALVVGGGSVGPGRGDGKALAALYAVEGAKVLVDLRQEAGDETVDIIRATSANASAVASDEAASAVYAAAKGRAQRVQQEHRAAACA